MSYFKYKEISKLNLESANPRTVVIIEGANKQVITAVLVFSINIDIVEYNTTNAIIFTISKITLYPNSVVNPIPFPPNNINIMPVHSFFTKEHFIQLQDKKVCPTTNEFYKKRYY